MERYVTALCTVRNGGFQNISQLDSNSKIGFDLYCNKTTNNRIFPINTQENFTINLSKLVDQEVFNRSIFIDGRHRFIHQYNDERVIAILKLITRGRPKNYTGLMHAELKLIDLQRISHSGSRLFTLLEKIANEQPGKNIMLADYPHVNEEDGGIDND